MYEEAMDGINNKYLTIAPSGLTYLSDPTAGNVTMSTYECYMGYYILAKN